MRTIRTSIVCACPNYTPVDWWECDVWAVSRAGYATEYECKLTVADFRADAKKASTTHRYDCAGGWSQTKEVKHGKLFDADPKGPSRFYYVVPLALASLEQECPAWAGFATLINDGEWRCGIRVLKNAPQIHRKKIDRREIRLAQSRMWYRYWDTIEALHQAFRAREVST